MTEETTNPPVLLPPCPQGFICHAIPGPFRIFVPRDCEEVTSVDFAWTWLNAYMKYYIRTNRKHAWELWAEQSYGDQGSEGFSIVAYGPYMRIPSKVAAVYLLAATWRETFEHKPRRYYVGWEILLSHDEIDAIMDMIFPVSTESSDTRDEW